MHEFAQLPHEEKRNILSAVAEETGTAKAVLEKDYWVSWTLENLFQIDELKENLMFKGGTSLSKAYNVIHRFSEDVDLTLSKSLPYFSELKNPAENGISNKEKVRRVKALAGKCSDYINNRMVHLVDEQFSKTLASGDWKVSIANDDVDNQTILFHYPASLDNEDRLTNNSYIRPFIRLELGARGDIAPANSMHIKPYIADHVEGLFTQDSAKIPTLAAERTFWEKITILHAIHHKGTVRDRMSRHYYDIHMLTQTPIAEHALNDPELLTRVKANNDLYFKDNRASLDTATAGTFRLIPSIENVDALRKDFNEMRNTMFMGSNPPDFDTIISSLTNLEMKMNAPEMKLAYEAESQKMKP